MRTTRFGLSPLSVGIIAATLVGMTVGRPSSALADETCNPPCGAGQICYQRTCLVPAPKAPPQRSTGPYAPPPASSPAPPAAGTPPAPGVAQVYGNPPPQTYPPQTYPPQTYPAQTYPPQTYPAQTYPAQTYPAQTYPPQTYPPQTYPPRTYPPQTYPQQGYPPPAYGYPPAPPPPPRKHVFLALPYIGLHSFQGDSGSALDPGFRLGALIGFRLGKIFSINGELSFDVLNFQRNSVGNDPTAVAFVFALSPLFHVVLPAVEMVFGPKLGLWAEAVNSTVAGSTVSDSYSGTLVGLNTGFFFPVGRTIKLGGFLSFDVRSYSRICLDSGTVDESCTTSNLPDVDKVFGFTGALLY